MLSQFWSKLSERERRGRGIAFPVDDVVAVEKPIWSETLAVSLSRRLGRQIFVLPEPNQLVTNAAFDALKPEWRARFDALPEDRRPASRCHPLVDAVHVAFSQHRPLTLSPDAVWLVIAQGFGHHVTANAETLRGRLVTHQGSRTLTATLADLTLAQFEHGIAELSFQIREATDPVLHETLASEVALMDSFSSYFDYRMGCICGIPRITIEGSPEDWQRIRARIEVLGTYGLEWWVSRLRPILDEFVLTAGGLPTREFWKAIYKPQKAYGDEAVTGWITDLFPYLGDAPRRQRNHVFEQERHDWALPIDKGVRTGGRMIRAPSSKGVGLRTFPSGLSSVPVKLTFNDRPDCDVELVAGFFAVQQHADGALSPVIGWSVAAPPQKKPGAVSDAG
jgi:hypothetical protein